MYETINERLKNDFYRDEEIEKLLPRLEEEVLSARKSSFVAANQALQQYYRRRNKI
jgi:LAO/AO transport system kinase